MGFKKNKKNSRQGAEESPRTSEAPRGITTPSPIADPGPPTPRTPRPNRPVVIPSVSPISPPDALRPNIRKALARSIVDRLQPADEALGREKRNFSQLSSTSVESREHKLTNSGQDIDIDDETSMKYQLQAHDQKIKAADSACEAAQATIQELRTRWQDGSLEMTRGQFQDEMKRQDRELGALFVERAHMRTSRFELAAREVDAEMWNKHAHAEDWAYIDQLVSRIQEPSGATVTMKNPRDPSKQERWRKDVIKAYGAKNDKEKIWCPISRQYLSSWMTTAAHIVRYNVGEPAAVHLFGPSDNSDGHIWSARNGIPLCKEYEQMLDDARIAIVPTTDGSGLMVVILDEAEREEEWDPTDHFPTGKALHGRTLEFLTDHRPSMRYIYFAFVINILRRQRFEVDGWWKDRLEYADIRFFPTPGKWIRETTLRKLAVRIGHLPIDDAGKFATTTCRGSQLEPPSSVGASEGKGKNKETDIATDEVADDAFSDLLAHSLNMDGMKAPEPDD